MMLPERTAVIVRTLMEYVRYEQNVFDNIERVLEIAHEMADEYRRAIEIALASDVALATLGPEYHPEVIVRKFLAEIRERLVQLSPAREPVTFN
ncbi:MAG: hypothetical protein M4D80_18070 [Myxococcota bacterium]|nr:hypothetical protein [Deltaproteobacteria bacterium]MDQ3337073.1 hypothetical protein [Myxococcota bacterium]